MARHDLGSARGSVGSAGGSDGGSADPEDRPSGVATFGEVLAAVEAADLTLLVDFKTGGDPQREATSVAEALSTFSRPDLVLVSSFSLPFLEQLALLMPELALYPIVSLRQNFLARLDFERWAGVSVLVHALLVNPMLWLGPRRADRCLLVWFAVTEWTSLLRLATGLGARGLIVKRVAAAVGTR